MYSVEAKLAERPQDYRWSSNASYLKERGVKKEELNLSSAQTVPPLCNSDEVGATDLRLTGIRKDRITMKVGYLRGVGLAAGVLLVALGTASADEWFVLSEKPIKSMDPSTEIKAEAGKFWKEDIKKTKITAEGADVEITKVVLRWKGRKDDTITNVGVVKAGGSTAEKDAPGREAHPPSVAVQYKVLGNKPTATSKFGDTTDRGVNTGQRT